MREERSDSEIPQLSTSFYLLGGAERGSPRFWR